MILDKENSIQVFLVHLKGFIMSDTKVKFHRFFVLTRGFYQYEVDMFSIPAGADHNYVGDIKVSRIYDGEEKWPGLLGTEDTDVMAIITVPKAATGIFHDSKRGDFYRSFLSTEVCNHLTKFTCHAYEEDFENLRKYGIDPYEAAAKRVIRSHIEGRSWPAKNEDVV